MYRDEWGIPLESLLVMTEAKTHLTLIILTDRPPTVRAGRLDNLIQSTPGPRRSQQSHGPVNERSAVPIVTVTLQ